MTADELPLEIRTMIDMVITSLDDRFDLTIDRRDAYRTSMLEIAVKAYEAGSSMTALEKAALEKAALEMAKQNALGAKEQMRQEALETVQHARNMIKLVRETTENVLNDATGSLSHKEAELRRR